MSVACSWKYPHRKESLLSAVDPDEIVDVIIGLLILCRYSILLGLNGSEADRDAPY